MKFQELKYIQHKEDDFEKPLLCQKQCSLIRFFLASFLLSATTVAFLFLPIALPLSASANDVSLTVTIIGDKQCNDGVDNDGDGKTDYPADSGCDSATDDNETNASGGGSSGGSLGGGGRSTPVTPANTVIFKGKAYPSSQVTLLKDAQIAAVTEAGPDANFEVRLSGLSGGTYVFGVRSDDKDGRRSLTHTFTVEVTSGVTTAVSGVFLPPTITLDKVEVKRGDILNILGQSIPNANITILIKSENELVKKTMAEADGTWFYRFDTLEVEYGNHLAQGRASKNSELSNLSKAVGFKVGTQNVEFVPVKNNVEKADVSGDAQVNLTDFSIAAFWYKRPSPPEHVDLNNDGEVDLVDFSIMAFYWTG